MVAAWLSQCSMASVLPPQVRLQVQSVEKPLYRGTFHCFQSIVRQESVSFIDVCEMTLVWSAIVTDGDHI